MPNLCEAGNLGKVLVPVAKNNIKNTTFSNTEFLKFIKNEHQIIIQPVPYTHDSLILLHKIFFLVFVGSHKMPGNQPFKKLRVKDFNPTLEYYFTFVVTRNILQFFFISLAKTDKPSSG